jgi:patatin-like phospholipase/acyl hydrolase
VTKLKTILSIDGGGIRGLIPAMVLAEIEKRTGKAVADLFDLVAGTSTGAILGMGLCKPDRQGRPEYSAKALARLYEQRGSEIFSRSLWKGLASAGGILDEKYSEDGLEQVLLEYFGEDVLGGALTDVLVTSYDIENRQPHFYKSWRDEWEDIPMRHAARATSAAPSYFEPALVPARGGDRALIDGGVFINNPAVSAYAEYRRIFPDEQDFFVVSLGTGEQVRPIPYEDARNWGQAEWVIPLLNCMFDGVSDAVNYQMAHMLGDDFVRFQTSLSVASDDMDNATQGNIQNLKSEARKLIRTQKAEIESVCDKLMQYAR